MKLTYEEYNATFLCNKAVLEQSQCNTYIHMQLQGSTYTGNKSLVKIFR